MEENKEKTVYDLLMEKLNKMSENYSDFIENIFIYGPDILNMNINDLKEGKDANNTNK